MKLGGALNIVALVARSIEKHRALVLLPCRLEFFAFNYKSFVSSFICISCRARTLIGECVLLHLSQSSCRKSR